LLIKDNYLCHTFVYTKLLQVIIKGFTWVVLVEKPSLEAQQKLQTLSSLPYSLLIHLNLFFSSLLVFDRSNQYIFNHICWLENFCVYTEISFHFLGCFAAYISKVLLADITGQRHIFGVFAA
jgi:hypothetical protein